MNLESVLTKKIQSEPTAIQRDLSINLERMLTQSALTEMEALFTLAATASSVGADDLVQFAEMELRRRDATAAQIQEAREAAAMMGMLNTYYRFKHMVTHNNPDAESRYQQAGLRMTSLARSALGKAQFEMIAFAVSVLNGCESCIRSHEKSLIHEGADATKIHDLARLAAVVKAWGTLSIL